MNKNCPNCGKPKNLTTRDLLFDMVGAIAGTKNPQYCQCVDASPPKFISGNWLTERRAKAKGVRWVDIWRTHNLPQMRDCRDLNYKYAIIGGRIICEACSDYYDVTEECLT